MYHLSKFCCTCLRYNKTFFQNINTVQTFHFTFVRACSIYGTLDSCELYWKTVEVTSRHLLIRSISVLCEWKNGKQGAQLTMQVEVPLVIYHIEAKRSSEQREIRLIGSGVKQSIEGSGSSSGIGYLAQYDVTVHRSDLATGGLHYLCEG